jgi:CRP-like cAMP-binding protein
MPDSFAIALNDLLKRFGQAKSFSKNEVILNAGEIERYVYFIQSGAVRLFLLTEHEEHTIRLGFNGTLITSLASLITESPSDFYMDSMRKTELIRLEFSILREHLNNSVEHQQLYMRFLEEQLALQVAREIDLLTDSPTMRLERILKRSPQLFNEIPLKYIASYLRMTPETLSRIRKS